MREFGGAPATFGLALLFFGWRRLSTARVSERPLSRGTAVLHGLCIACLLAIELWFSPRRHTLSPESSEFHIMASIWTALIPLAVLTLAGALVPFRSLWRLIRRLGVAWAYATICTVSILVLRHFGTELWSDSSSSLLTWIHNVCFSQTRALLHLFYPVVVSVPEKHLLGTPRYVIEVSWLCSGIEGLGLVTLLLVLWLIFYRRELRLGRAILVAPVALLATWMANLIRLATLIAIGDHGHPFIASVGFHAQAGWITLNLVALGCLAIVQHTAWFRKDDGTGASPAVAHLRNYAAIYLLPFTLVVAASLITQGLAELFEALYPLRVIVALIAIWIFRRDYRRMNWRFGVPAVLAGLAVGAMWIVLYTRFKSNDASVIQTAIVLAQTTRLKRWTWIGFRVLGAVVTVPIAEELAFRGFLSRRVMGAEFQCVAYKDMNGLSLAVSSIVFGVMHGRMWLPGIVAGAIFWLCARLRNRVGEATMAHAIANAVIAVAVLIRHDYSMW